MTKFEELAKAICEANDDDWYREGPGGLMFGYAPLARAALQALRVPNERMIAEGESAASFGIGKPADDEAIPRVWNWMVDAILAEE